MTVTYSGLIRDARSRAGLSQQELARRVGTSQAVISAYENGRREPGFTQVQRLLAAAGFSLQGHVEPLPLPLPTEAEPWNTPDSDEDDDRILENLRLTPAQRLRKMGAMRAFASRYRGALTRKP